eukprot:9873791-Karenia_brevis.AAC.1
MQNNLYKHAVQPHHIHMHKYMTHQHVGPHCCTDIGIMHNFDNDHNNDDDTTQFPMAPCPTARLSPKWHEGSLEPGRKAWGKQPPGSDLGQTIARTSLGAHNHQDQPWGKQSLRPATAPSWSPKTPRPGPGNGPSRLLWSPRGAPSSMKKQ